MSQSENSKKLYCVELDVLRDLVKDIVAELHPQEGPWIDEEEARHLLRIGSKTTLIKYREMGKIDFRRINQRKIIYRRKSILDFIESFGQEENEDDNG